MEDAAIVALYWARDEQALAETAAKFGAYCRKIADNILHSAHDAEECENDTWLAAWNSMPTNRPARLAPYLGRITRNLALDRFDRAAAQKRGSGQTCAPLDELAECVAAPDMPMLDAAAPQAADADEGAAVEKDSAASGIALGLAQCVQIDGVLYFDTGSAVDCPPDRGADGVIETSVDRDAFPETDGCSNFGTGYSYWVTGDNAVVVEIDGEYCEFEAN